MLYELSFNYWDDDPANDDEIILAVYSSEEQLKKVEYKSLIRWIQRGIR